MKKYWLFVLSLASFSPTHRLDYSFVSPEETYSLGGKEDINARLTYEQQLLQNPTLGSIPGNIRSRELRFESQLISSPRYVNAESKRRLVNDWEVAGPFNVGGRTRGVAFDKLDEKTLIAGGVSGGIWKSTTGGSSWRRVSDPENRNSVSCLTQDLRTGKEMNWYHGTGELVGNSTRAVDAPYRGDGIYHSSDGGESWIPLPATQNGNPTTFNSQFQYVWKLLVDHQKTNTDEIYAATIGGIVKSSDGGTTWINVIGPKRFDFDSSVDLNDSTLNFFTNIIQTPSGHLFATMSSSSGKTDSRNNNILAKNAGFYFSETGDSWIKINPPTLPAYYERTVMNYSISDDRMIYFFTKGVDESDLYLHKYTLNEVTNGNPAGIWSDLSENIPQFGGQVGNFDTQLGYNMMISVHPENSDIVFLGGTNLYRSTSGFRSRVKTKWIGGYDPDNDASLYPNHHPDQHLALFYPSDPDRLLSANDGGLHFTADATADSVKWTPLNNGFVTSQFYSIAQQKDKSSLTIFGGMQDNGSYIRDAPGENPSWNQLLGGDGGYTAISRSKTFVYASFQFSQIYRLTVNSNNQLTSYARVDPTGVEETETKKYLFINPYVLDPLNTNRMFLIGITSIWRNENLAQISGSSQKKTNVNWTELEDTRYGGGIYTALTKHFSDDVIYAGIYKNTTSTNRPPEIIRIDQASIPGLETVTDFNHSTTFPNGGYISCIRTNPEDSDELLVIFSNYGVPSIFHSADGGLSFQDVGGNLEEFPDGTGDGPSVRWAEVVPTKSGIQYYVGTSIGLFSTSTLNGANTLWIKESEELIGKAVIVMMDYRTLDGRLVVATHGNGTFQSYLNDWKLIQNTTQSNELIVKQNFPNPFRNQTYIQFSLPADGLVQIDLYDASGKLIKNLLYGPQFAGDNTVVWDGTNVSGVPVTSGVYLCRLAYGNKVKTRQLIFQP